MITLFANGLAFGVGISLGVFIGFSLASIISSYWD
jgi:hypothetical protein